MNKVFSFNISKLLLREMASVGSNPYTGGITIGNNPGVRTSQQYVQPAYQSVVQSPMYQTTGYPTPIYQNSIVQPSYGPVAPITPVAPIAPVAPVRPVAPVTQSKLAARAVTRPPFPSAIPNEAPPIGTRKMAYNGYGVLPPVGSGIMSTPEELAMAQFGQSTFNTLYTSQVPAPAPVVATSVVREPVVVRTSVRAPSPPPVVKEVVVTPPPQPVVVQPPPPPPAVTTRRNSFGATTLGGGNPYGLAALNRGSSGYNAINNASARNVGRLDPKTSLPALNMGDIDGYTANQQYLAGNLNVRPVNHNPQSSGFGPVGPVYAPGANPMGYNSVSSFVAGTQGAPIRPY